MDNFTAKSRILHIDDDVNFLELFRIVFQDLFIITSLGSGAEAMELISTEEFDAVITDYDMPVMGGLELLCRIKALKPDLPVILETGQGNEEVAREAFIQGASDYFTKDYFGFAHKEKFYNSVSRAIEIKKAKEEKVSTEKKYRHLYDRASEGIFIARMNRIILANPAFQKITGYNEETLRTINFSDIIHPDDAHFVLDRHIRRFSGEKVQEEYDFRIITADKKVRWLRINASAIEWDNEIVTLNFTGDITERKMMEEKVRIERDKAQKYLDIAGVIFLALNVKGEVILINKKGCEILGYEEKEILGKNWFVNFVPPVAVEGKKQDFNMLAMGQSEFAKYYEDVVLTRDGSEKIIAWYNTVIRDDDGNIIGTLSSGEDITMRREAEREQKKLAMLIDNSLEFIGISTMEGDVIYINQAGLEICGLKNLEEARTKKIFDFLPERVAHEFNDKALSGLFARGYDEGESQLLNFKTGESIDVDFNAFLINSHETGKPINIAIVIKDITQRKEAQNLLKESEANLRSIFRAAPVGIGLIDKDRIIRRINNRFCQMLGYTKDELLGQNARLLYSTERDYEYVGREKYKQIYKTGSGIVETRFQRKDGSKLDIILSSTPVDLFDLSKGVIFTAVDITERKITERALEDSEAKYRLLVENQNDLIVKFDPKFRLTFVSPNYCKILGKTEKQLLGKTFFPYISEEDVESVRENLESLKNSPYTCENEERLMTVKGERWYHWSNRAVLDKKGKIKEVFAVGRDITEKKLFEDAIQSILSTGASLLGDNFFREIVRQLGRLVGADYAFVGEIFREETSMVKTISFYGEGKILDNITFEMMNTPCEKAMTQVVYSLESSASRLFPDAKILKKFDIQGYVGVPLFDSQNQQLGIMVALFKEPVSNIRFAESILQLFANRVASEVERRRLEEAYSSIVENSLQAIGIIQDNQVVFANSTLEKIMGFSREQLFSLDSDAFSKLIYPADRERVIDTVTNRVKGKEVPPENEFRIVNKNREVRWVETLSRVVEFRNKPAVQFAMLDITEKKRAEEETKLFKTIAQSANYGAIITNYEGYLLYANDYFARIHGYDPNELVGKHLSLFHNKKQAIHVGQIMKSLKMNGSLRAREVWHTKKDGTPFPMLMTHVLISSKNDLYPCIAATAIDISDIKDAEKALRESETKYRSLAENTPDVIMRFDRDCRYVYLNSEAQKLMNIDPELVIGKSHSEIAQHPEDHIIGEQMIRSVFETGEPIETEFQHYGINGQLVFDWRLFPEYNENDEIETVMGIARDITQQRQTEKKFQMLFDQMLSGISIHKILVDENNHPTDYRFLNVNPAFERLTGLPAEEIIGKTVREVMPGTEQYWIDNYGKVALTGEPTQFENYSSELGKHFEVIAFQTAPGEFACAFQDITERKLAQQKTLESLQEKEILLSEIHHRVKNNLQVIISLLGMQMDYINDENVIAAVMESMNRIKSMAFIHQRLYRSTDLAHVDLKGYIKVLADNLIQTYNVSNNGLSIDLKIDDIFLKIDAAIPCGLILNELISNSLKHAFTDRKKGKICISLNKNENDSLTMVVEDNGIGMGGDIDFNRQKSLGLRLVRLLVNQLRGSVEVDRTHGTKFVINFKG